MKTTRNAIKFIKQHADYIIVNEIKRYSVPVAFVSKYVEDAKYDGSILHNFENKAMLDFVDSRSGESVFRICINPEDSSYDEEWVIDN